MGKYDSIRPYNDAEVAAAMKRLAGTKAVAGIEKHLFPDKEPGYLAKLLPTLDTVESFQVGVMKDVIARIIHSTTNG
ncbi:MAG: acyltransferase, partial [Bacteroidales bacterium]|nr:acyltransferase [Bacteroidales bacterium]